MALTVLTNAFLIDGTGARSARAPISLATCNRNARWSSS